LRLDDGARGRAGLFAHGAKARAASESLLSSAVLRGDAVDRLHCLRNCVAFVSDSEIDSLTIYSYRNASIGLIRDAFTAG